MEDDALVIIFSKQPEPGLVKTRLIPDLGEQGAYDVYVALFHEVCQSATHFAARSKHERTRVEIWLAEGARADYKRALEKRFAVHVRDQASGDLGQKLAHALVENTLATSVAESVAESVSRTKLEKAQRKKVLIIGGDCASIDAGYLQMALDRLNDCECVIGPAEDGGFVLLGLKYEQGLSPARINAPLFNGLLPQAKPALFSDIVWGGEHVFSLLCSNLRRCRVHFDVLDEGWDVDTIEDVSRWRSLRHASKAIT